jgi:GT2 family glycosyltransferase
VSDPLPDMLGLDKLVAPELDVLFRHAERMGRDSAWFGHVPFAHWLVRALRPRLLVELGTHWGISYAAFCQAVEAEGLGTRCYAVDTWQGDDHAGHYPEAVFTDFAAYHDARFAGFSQLLRCTFDAASERFADQSIDLLHIDGLHTYDAVKNDFERWCGKMSTRGVVLFHDTAERAGDFGVWRLWDEVSARWPSFSFAHAHGLGVLCIGADVPPALRTLCALPDDVAATVRSRLARMGERWESESRAIRVARIASQSDARLREVDAARLKAVEAAAAAGAAMTARFAMSERAMEAGRRAAEQRVAAAAQETEALRAEVQRLQSNAAVDQSRLQELARALDTLVNSTSWKLTWPLRWLAGSVPPSFRWHGRRVAKLAWCGATPWRVPYRLRVIRERHRLAAARADQPAEIGVVAADDNDPYQVWIRGHEAALPAPPSDAGEPVNPDDPSVSFLLASAIPADAVAATLASLRAQTSNDYEVLTPPETAGAERAATLDALLRRARGRWVAVLDAGDILAPDALSHMRPLLADAEIAVLYSDDDETRDGRRSAPLLKPAWSPEMLQAFNYFGRLTLLRRNLALMAGGFVAGEGAGTEWSLHLRATQAAEAAGQAIGRISRVLCHRAPDGDRDRPAPKTDAAAQHRAVLRAFWARSGVQATVETQPDGTQRSSWDVADPPLVSVIIPNRNHADMLRCCLEGILDGTDYPRVEVIIVENRSDDAETWRLYETIGRRPNVRIIRFDRTFNYSAACNRGAAVAKGSLLLFLNNDVEVTDPRWLGEMVRVAMLPGVGVVGTRLRYPSGELQHAGVGVGIHLFALMYHRVDEAQWGVFGSPNHTRNWSAIMGACQMVRRETFDLVGGFDEAYQMANSDVALCLRALRAGWRTAYTPFAELIHHEGKTRGFTNPPPDLVRSGREVLRLGITEDPYLHPELGADAVPRLRAPGEDRPRDRLRQDVARLIASVPAPEPSLDLFDDRAMQEACGLSSAAMFWAPTAAWQIRDEWGAARWIVDLLRSRADVRLRFPHALSDGAAGAFACWLIGEGGYGLQLSDAARGHVAAAFAADPAARARRFYEWQDDLREATPLALLPPGRRALAQRMLTHPEANALRREEVWWFLLQCAEDPAGALVSTYVLTPAWQEAHPDGLTVFGRDRFAGWLAAAFDVPDDAEWLRPQGWPVALSAVEQIRVAYATRDDWQLAHPHAYRSEADARALLEWLASDAGASSPEIRAWCAERLADRSAARLACPGANILGAFCAATRGHVSAEAIACAIEAAGGAVSRRDIRGDPNDAPRHTAFGGLEAFGVTIVHAQPGPVFEHAYARADLLERTPRTYRIGYWQTNVATVPAAWGEMALTVDEIWTPTCFAADAIRPVSSVPVHALLPSVPSGPFVPCSRRAFGLTGREDGRFAFLFAFDTDEPIGRANPLGLIRAFTQAFSAEEKVDLVLKTTSRGRGNAELDALRAAIGEANVVLLDADLPSDQMRALVDACDAYVSLHRSEGCGLALAEAMMLGKPVIATRYSGNLDFMDDGNSLLVDCDLVPIAGSLAGCEEAALWAEPSIDHAAQLMRGLVEDGRAAERLGTTARRDAQARMSPAAAGRRIVERLAEIERAGYAARLSNGHADSIAQRSFSSFGV